MNDIIRDLLAKVEETLGKIMISEIKKIIFLLIGSL